jgi:hypothetical protein
LRLDPSITISGRKEGPEAKIWGTLTAAAKTIGKTRFLNIAPLPNVCIALSQDSKSPRLEGAPYLARSLRQMWETANLHQPL